MSNKLIGLSQLQEFKTKSDLKYQDKLTAGNNISISNDVISAIEGGVTYVGVTLPDTQSIANNTVVKIEEITLQPGKYIITYTCTFNSNSSGYRQCGFSLNTTDITGFGRNWGDSRRAVSGDRTQTCVSGTFEVSASDYPNGRTFYFLARQNCGSALTARPRFSYIKF